MSLSELAIFAEISDTNRLAEADDVQRALTDIKVRKAVAKDKAVNIPDGGGLGLLVTASGGKFWRYRYRLDGQQIFSIGTYPAYSLSDARIAHRAARWLVARNIHPKAHINSIFSDREKTAEGISEGTFSKILDAWCATKSPRLKSERALKNRRAMLLRHVSPVIGHMQITAITRRDMIGMFEAIDEVAPMSANHCLIYVRQIFQYAIDREIVTSSPVPGKNILAHCSSREVKPRKALPMAKMGEFQASMSKSESSFTAKSAMQLLLLTWCRTVEVTEAPRSEFDIDTGIWVIPKERMKNRVEHTVYLSEAALDIVKDMMSISTGDPKKDVYLFPSTQSRGKGSMGRMTLNSMLRRNGWKASCDNHGFRATASTWANESGKYRHDVIEAALSHTEKDGVRRAYNRAKYETELRALWADWADALAQSESDFKKKSLKSLSPLPVEPVVDLTDIPG